MGDALHSYQDHLLRVPEHGYGFGDTNETFIVGDGLFHGDLLSFRWLIPSDGL
jgi:hypothetical protein